MDLDIDKLGSYSAAELEAELHRLDELKQAVRARMRLVGQALADRHALDVAAARVARMGDGERQALTIALAGIPSEEAVG